MNAAARIYPRTNSATIAATGSLSARLKNVKGGFMITAIGVAAFAAGWLGAVGLGAGHVLERKKHGMMAKNQKKVLADYYKNQVAATLGIDPSKVDVQALEMAARVNPMIAQAIKKVNIEQDNANRGSLMATGGAMALGGAAAGLGWVPGGSGIAHLAAKGAVDVTGAVAGSAVSVMFDKNMLHTNDVMEMISAKRAQGQQITPHDIVLLRISQDEAWQKEFKAKHGQPFHKLNEHQQQAVVNGMPEMLVETQKQAYAINQGLIGEQDLLMPANGAGFTAAETARREQSAALAR